MKSIRKLSLNSELQSNQTEIVNTFTALWQGDEQLRLRIETLVEKFRRLLPEDSQSTLNQSVQAMLVAQNTFLVMVKTVIETVYPDSSSEEWIELEDEFNEYMRRGDRSASIVQNFRQLADGVYALIELDQLKYNREISQLWGMVKLCYRKQSTSGL